MKRIVLTLVFAVACRSASAPPETASAASSGTASAQAASAQAAAAPCPVPVPPNTGEWRKVDGTGITFCVPVSWRVANQRAIYSGGTVRWQYGGARINTPAPNTGGRGPGSITSVGARTSAGTTMGRRVTTNEMVGGQMADIFFEEGNGRVSTGASFRDPPLTFTGEATGQDNVALQLAVYRTIRFTRN